MHFLLDNLSAQIIAGGLLVILLGIQMRGQRAVQEVTSFYALRNQQLAFVEFMKRDMRNVTQVQSTQENPSDGTFTFQARTDPGLTTPHTVVYRRVWQRKVGGLDQYRVERYVDGALDGMSLSTITAWQIEARNADGVAVGAPADARQIFVHFEAVNPFTSGTAVDHSRWEASFRPPLIQQIESL